MKRFFCLSLYLGFSAVFWGNPLGLPSARAGDGLGAAFDSGFSVAISRKTLQDTGSFTESNELAPVRAAKILAANPRGVQLSVGAERGLFLALQRPGAAIDDPILLIDSDPVVIRYNQIHRALLKLAKKDSLEDFLFLRNRASAQDWKNRVLSEGLGFSESPGRVRLNEAEKKLLSDQANHSFWRRKRSGVGSSAGDPSEEGAFQGVDFRSDQKLFSKVQSWALDGKIGIGRVDLRDSEEIEKLSRFLEAEGAKIALLDISNAHGKYFLLADQLQDVVQKLAPFSSEKAIFLVSSYVPMSSNRLDFFAYTGFFLKELGAASERRAAQSVRYLARPIRYLGENEYIPNAKWENRLISSDEASEPQFYRQDRRSRCRNALVMERLKHHGELPL